MKIWNAFQAVFSAFGGVLGWFIGGLDGLLHALLLFVVVDYLTGLLRAIVEKKLSSRIGARGIAKKVAIFLIVGIANIADIYLLGGGSALRTATIFFYCSNEGISLLENATALGLPTPQPIKDALTQIKKKSEKDEKEE
jgi:toxin secretion/phage lysis holin